MFARLTVLQGPPDKVDEGIRVAREIASRSTEMPGFAGGTWAVDRSSGKGLAFTLWETQQAMQDSEAFGQQVREDAARTVGGQVLSVETFEVIAQA